MKIKLSNEPVYVKKPVFNDSKADIKALEIELESERRINRLNGQIIDCYQNEILPSWRERLEKVAHIDEKQLCYLLKNLISFSEDAVDYHKDNDVEEIEAMLRIINEAERVLWGLRYMFEKAEAVK